eukprot:s1744_g12.t1
MHGSGIGKSGTGYAGLSAHFEFGVLWTSAPQKVPGNPVTPSSCSVTPGTSGKEQRGRPSPLRTWKPPFSFKSSHPGTAFECWLFEGLRWELGSAWPCSAESGPVAFLECYNPEFQLQSRPGHSLLVDVTEESTLHAASSTQSITIRRHLL